MTESEHQPARGLRDIARLAGVSHQTVSRVLNEHPNIRPETRAKVLAVIDAEKFRPSRVARALTTNRHARIGVVVDGVMQIGPSSTLRAIEDAAYKRDYAVSSLTVSDAGETRLLEAVNYLQDHGIDGLITIVPRTAAIQSILGQTEVIPTVVLNAETHDVRRAISVDHYRGARLAVAHLRELGHRVIMHIAGPRDWAESQVREQGWREELVLAGLPIRPPLVGDWSADYGYAAAKRVAATADCTAVFAANDQMALGLIHGLHDLGIRVPEEISVVGFDDIPEARHLLPPLTTVRQDFTQLGIAAVSALVELIDNPKAEAEVRRIEPVLIVRESSTVPGVRRT